MGKCVLFVKKYYLKGLNINLHSIICQTNLFRLSTGFIRPFKS